jgi:hypothetical protein
MLHDWFYILRGRVYVGAICPQSGLNLTLVPTELLDRAESMGVKFFLVESDLALGSKCSPRKHALIDTMLIMLLHLMLFSLLPCQEQQAIADQLGETQQMGDSLFLSIFCHWRRLAVMSCQLMTELVYGKLIPWESWYCGKLVDEVCCVRPEQLSLIAGQSGAGRVLYNEVWTWNSWPRARSERASTIITVTQRPALDPTSPPRYACLMERSRGSCARLS